MAVIEKSLYPGIVFKFIFRTLVLLAGEFEKIIVVSAFLVGYAAELSVQATHRKNQPTFLLQCQTA